MVTQNIHQRTGLDQFSPHVTVKFDKPIAAAIIGGGTVGRALAQRLNHLSFDVRIVDIIHSRSTHTLHDAIREVDVVFICLPTPGTSQGSLDTSVISRTVEQLNGSRLPSTVPIVIRSTLNLNTTNQIAERYKLPNLFHCPEFIDHKTAYIGTSTPRQVVVGLPRLPSIPFVHSELYQKDHQRALDSLYAILTRAFGCPIHCVSSTCSELIKLAMNSFFAVKNVFFNEMSLVAYQNGIDWQDFLLGILADGRITSTHTQVPGPDGKPGFGGECLPKDLAALSVDTQTLTTHHMSPYHKLPQAHSLLTVANFLNTHMMRKV